MQLNNLKLLHWRGPATPPESPQHVWALRIDAVIGGADAPVFVFKQTDEGDVFQTVASLHDIYEIPASKQTKDDSEENWNPYFRHHTVTLSARTPVLIEEAWSTIMRHARMLMRNWDAARKLEAVEEVELEISDGALIENVTTFDPGDATVLQIHYEPAGTPDIVSGSPVIPDPDTELTGWLPVGQDAPDGAIWIYNASADAAFSSLLPLSTYSGLALVYNNVHLEKGVHYTVEGDNLYWLDGPAPASNPSGWQAAPWPSTYISSGSPGPHIPKLEFVTYAN